MLYTEDIEKIAEILRQDGICAIPTETVYGLAGNGLKPEVISRIFEIKNRPSFDPLILHVSSIEAVNQLVLDIPPPALQLMEAFWPGPLTILLPRNNKIPDILCSGSDWAGFRIPNHPHTLKLLQALDFPLAAPSANPFGYISPTQSNHVMDQLGNKIEGILEGGACTIGIESTVVRVKVQEVEILRPGAISAEEITSVTGLPVKWVASSDHPTAPGMLEMHYAPRKGMSLDSFGKGDSEFTAWLRFSTFRTDIPVERQLILAPDASLHTAARNLFAYMRQLDQDNRFTQIIAQLVPSQGIGVAINDKLRKASAMDPKSESSSTGLL